MGGDIRMEFVYPSPLSLHFTRFDSYVRKCIHRADRVLSSLAVQKEKKEEQ